MTDDRAITVANDESLSDMIRQAKRRLVVLSPGFTNPVAKVLAERWRALGAEAVSVVVDIDPEVYRLGFGELEGLKLLEKTAAELGTTLNRQKGLRIGLVIADDETLVYSPTPLLVEAGPRKPDTPNAIRLGPPPPSVTRDLGQGENGVRDQKIGLDKAEKATIEKVEANLKENPPQRFDVARTVRVFNTYFEFVEFSMKGAAIQRKKVRLPKHLSQLTGNKQLDDFMEHSVNLVEQDTGITSERLDWYKSRIIQNYLTSIPGYGNVVLRKAKDSFEREVDFLRRCMEQFQARTREKLQAVLDRRREELVNQMLPHVVKNPPPEWNKFLSGFSEEDIVRRILDRDLEQVFAKAFRSTERMDLKLLFKGVTYETLNDPKFIELAKMHLPALEQLHKEYDAAEGQKVDAST